MVDWTAKCNFGVERKYAAQHGHCASCPYFIINRLGFPNKCTYGAWEKDEEEAAMEVT